jgi:hypothetical protein
MYKLIKNIDGGESNAVVRFNADGSTSSIPFAPDNTDYQAYLKWVAEGNTPEEADDAIN